MARIENEVLLQFISDKMLSPQEEIILAIKKSYVDRTGENIYYKVVTVTPSGQTRKYIKDIGLPTYKWVECLI